MSMAKTPTFLKETAWRNPQDPSNCAFQAGHQTQQNFFEFVAGEPDLLAPFHNALSTSNEFRLYRTVEELPWSEIIGPTEASEIALVDIGGADGSVLRQILDRFPDVPGKFILQDRLEVIEKVPEDVRERIEVGVYAIFTSQPVKGITPSPAIDICCFCCLTY
jgi:hypothetical protein